MARVKEQLGFSAKAEEEFALTEKALKKVANRIIEKTKKNNSYLITSDKNGKVIKVPAKSL